MLDDFISGFLHFMLFWCGASSPFVIRTPLTILMATVHFCDERNVYRGLSEVSEYLTRPGINMNLLSYYEDLKTVWMGKP